jgi:hypothetical protein
VLRLNAELFGSFLGTAYCYVRARLTCWAHRQGKVGALAIQKHVPGLEWPRRVLNKCLTERGSQYG